MKGFLERQRILRQTVSSEVRHDTMAKEIRAGKLSLPVGAASRFVSGSINPETGVPDEVRVWTELALPFAEIGGTGLGSEDTGEDPWMMSSERYSAHVMIGWKTVKWGEVSGHHP